MTEETSQLAVNAKKLAAMLGLSERTIRQLDAGGKLPKPVKIGARSVRWPVAEIDAWLAAGAPDRATWNAMRGNRSAASP
ncbi:MAG: AlpA family phage regulatory protein [Planctomycetes bacterium]|nr:AlpA family phage regulatory protein [Planctomycetota bacterium]